MLTSENKGETGGFVRVPFGVIRGKGIVNNDQHLRFLLGCAEEPRSREPELEAVS